MAVEVTEDQLHPDLRAAARRMRPLTWALKQSWGPRMANATDGLARRLPTRDLTTEEYRIPSRHGGPPVRVLVVRSSDHDEPVPGVLYLHGGGYMLGSPDTSMGPIRAMLETRPCVVVAPAYRKSVQDPWPAGFDDCWDTLLWLRDNAEVLGIRPGRFAVAGHSAGGGMTAAVSLKARDTGEVDIAFQMPIYPMIDDRARHPSSRLMSPMWDAELNEQAWDLYLRGVRDRGGEIPAYAAPARASDMSGLPPTVTFVGDMEPFHDETVEYVQRLRDAAVPVTFQRFEGCFHGFDQVAGGGGPGREAREFTRRAFADHVDRHLSPDDSSAVDTAGADTSDEDTAQ